MNIFVASDIHGSAFWCRKMLEACEREGAERLLLLGDILYHGPRNDLPEQYSPKEVFAMLNRLGDRTLAVRGNCEAEIDELVLDFPIVSECALLCPNGRLIFATHGHVFNAEKLPPLHAGDILLHGHTHRPCWERTPEGVRIFNPGSVSLPKDGSPRGYLTLRDGEALWKTLDGAVYHRSEL